MACKAWLSLTAVPQWSVTLKPKQCALGENEGGGPFSMHTQRAIFIIKARDGIQSPMAQSCVMKPPLKTQKDRFLRASGLVNTWKFEDSSTLWEGLRAPHSFPHTLSHTFLQSGCSWVIYPFIIICWSSFIWRNKNQKLVPVIKLMLTWKWRMSGEVLCDV